MFKDLGYNRADCYTPEIVACERFITALIGFRNRNNITVSIKPAGIHRSILTLTERFLIGKDNI